MSKNLKYAFCLILQDESEWDESDIDFYDAQSSNPTYEKVNLLISLL